MKKYMSIVLILFASLLYTISYAYDDSNSGEKTFKLNEVDTPPRFVKVFPPHYPKKVKGHVILKFIITKDGEVRNPEVIEAAPEGIFEDSVLKAVKNWRFKPATKNGEPVDCTVIQPFMLRSPGVNTPLDKYEETKKGFQFIKAGESFEWIVTTAGKANFRGIDDEAHFEGLYDATQKGFQFIKAGEYENAVKAYTKAIKINKKYSPAYTGRGVAYMNLKEYEKAMEDFNVAIKKSGKIALNYKLRGEVYSALKDYNTAIKDFDRAIKMEPQMLEAYFERGNAFRDLDKFSEAIVDYTKVIELDKSYLQAYNNRAVAYNKLNDSKNMCLDIKKACDLGDCRGLELAQKAGKCSVDASGN